ncbi:MFS transporter [Bacillus sp. FJAT-53060]|uniref:MFS transporter n=1 Tax=Bacillus TaxID=1386 RepID=UPI001CFADCE6|nr:MFS transporter [Bacillus stratosphericus]
MEKTNLSESVWNKRFTSLFISRLIKNTGESFAFTSVLWLLILRGDGALGTGLLLAVTVLPSSLLAPILGPLMKKHHLSKWMFASDVVRATIVLIIPLLHFSNLLPLWLLISLMVIQSATGAAYNPASVAILPQIVPKHLIQKANAILQSSFEIVALAAVMVAGLLVKLIGPADTLLITTALFIISGLFIIGVKLKKTEEEKAAGIKQVKNTYLYNLKRGFLVVRNHHILFALTLYCVLMNVAAAPWQALSAVYVAEALLSDSMVYSILRGVAAVGAFMMGFALAKVKIKRFGLFFIVAGMIEGGAFFITGMSTWLPIVLLASFMFGAAVSAINVPEMVIIQTSVDQEDQPQVYAVINASSNVFLPLAAVVSGVLAEKFGAGPVIAGGGVLEILSGIAIFLFTGLAKSHLTAEKQKSETVEA